MGYEYDFEAVVKEVPPAIENIEGCLKKMASFVEHSREVAKQVNAPAFTKVVDSLGEGFEALTQTTKSLIGQEGDTAQEATAWGVYGSAERTLKRLGGV